VSLLRILVQNGLPNVLVLIEGKSAILPLPIVIWSIFLAGSFLALAGADAVALVAGLASEAVKAANVGIVADKVIVAM
jgi:hypothetical protein